MEWMTVEEALANGWTLAGTTWQMGYVSRRADVGKQRLRRVPRGRRAGQYYFLLPSFMSTCYCHRQYINPPTVAYYRDGGK